MRAISLPWLYGTNYHGRLQLSFQLFCTECLRAALASITAGEISLLIESQLIESMKATVPRLSVSTVEFAFGFEQYGRVEANL